MMMTARSKYFVASREPCPGKCTFCRIIGTSAAKPGDKIIYENERLVVFPDRSPAALQHLLVVPKAHIASTDCLSPGDLDLVQEMQATGEKLLKENAGTRPLGPLRFGYHRPPWRSVDHLHLHCFEEPFKGLKRWKYSDRLPKVWLGSETLQSQLSSREGASKL